LRFLLARFLYADAILTIIAMMTVYMGRVGDFSASTKFTVLALAMVCAALGGFIAGSQIERVGPRMVLTTVLMLTTVTLIGAAATGSPLSVWFLAPLVGVSLGGVWASDRVFMMRLCPPSARGEFFSFYNLVGRASAGFGPLVLWGGTVSLVHGHLGWSLLSASRMALVSLMAATVVGLLVMRTVSDEKRDWSQDPLELALEDQAQ
jgi:UMF1 family MFS transporter